MSICQCGNTIKKNDKFCSKCGTKISTLNVPGMLPDSEIDYNRLKESAKSIIDEILQNGFINEDSEHYLYEDIMTVFYGSKIFDWIRNNTD